MNIKQNKAKIVVTIVFIVGFGLLSNPNVRHYILSGFVKIPSLISEMRYQSFLQKRQFEEVVKILNNEYNFIKKIDERTGRFALYLVENIRKTYDLTTLASEKKHYEGLVKDMNVKFPGILPLLQIESDILLNKNGRNFEIIENIELQSLNYYPLYTDILISDYINQDIKSKWCKPYYGNNFIKTTIPYSRNMLLKGDGELALVIENDNIENIYQMSLVNAKDNIVRFNLDSPFFTDRFSLVFSSQLGSSISINGLGLINKGRMALVDDYKFYSKGASFTSENSAIFFNSNPKFNFILKDKIKFDTIELNLTINRPNPIPKGFCNLSKNN
jgi:hypothetical protein